MREQILPMALYFLAGLSGAGGQWLYKQGAGRLGQDPIWQNWQLFAGVLAFTFVMVCFVASFKLGGRLSVVYPMYATTFIWGAAIGVWIEGEPWSWLQLGGILTIVGGCAMVALGAPEA